jgi:hypothetical protein
LLNVVVSSDSANGTSSAANTPWQARAVTSMAKLTEAPPTVTDHRVRGHHLIPAIKTAELAQTLWRRSALLAVIA